eukprot:1722952-Prorocentrum_lima.AAC.1
MGQLLGRGLSCRCFRCARLDAGVPPWKNSSVVTFGQSLPSSCSLPLSHLDLFLFLPLSLGVLFLAGRPVPTWP